MKKEDLYTSCFAMTQEALLKDRRIGLFFGYPVSVVITIQSPAQGFDDQLDVS